MKRKIILHGQSTKTFQLIKEVTTQTYYIKRLRDKKYVLIGDKETAENFILDGLYSMREDVKQLFSAKQN